MPIRRGLFFFCFLLMVQLALGQAGAGGRVVSATSQAPIVAAQVSLNNPEGAPPKGALTNDRGIFRMMGISPGPYTLTVSAVGFEPYSKEIIIEAGPNRIGLITLSPKTVELDEVTIEGKTPAAQQQGDTTIFNAGSYKTNPDATAEDLVGKLPGVVNDNGQIQAQGENVQQVLVDGKPFLGTDPNAALKNLPAEVIDKIQVFDQQSQQAQFTGFDDGNTTKTINIITKPGKNQGEFGKIYAGYGNDLTFDPESHRYRAGGNINIFKGNSRLSLIAQTNNINQQNFATEDLLGVVGSSGSGGAQGGRRRGRRGPPGRGGVQGADVSDFLVGAQGGISQTTAAGVNYMDKWGPKVEVAGSYFFNLSDNTNQSDLNQLYVSTLDSGQIYTEATETNSQNINHRFNAELEYKLDARNSFFIRPRVSLQSNQGIENSEGSLTLGDGLLSSIQNAFESDLQAANLSSTFLWRHAFPKRRRTLSVNVTPSYSSQSGTNALLADQAYFTPPVGTDTTDQQATLEADTRILTTQIRYTEPISEKMGIELSYRQGIQLSSSDKQTLTPAQLTGEYTVLDSSLSNATDSRYLTHEGGIGLRYGGRGTKLIMGSNLAMQWSSLLTEQQVPQAPAFSQTFLNFVPRLFLRYKIDAQKTLRAIYRASTQAPTITQLQDVIDNSNPLQLQTGNPTLDQAWQHQIFMRYNQTNTDNSSVFFMLINASATANYIGQQTLFITQDSTTAEGFALQAGDQLRRPVNLDGYYSARTYLTYGFPIAPIKTNLNTDFNLSYVRQPGLLDTDLNYAHQVATTVGVTFASNISEQVDFTLSSRTGYNLVRNTLQPTLDQTYVSQRTRLRFNLILPDGIVLRTQVTHQYYDGLSADFDQNYVLWNGAIAKKFGKDDRAEIALSVYDALRQNTNVSRSVTDIYIEDAQSLVLQRYVMLTLTYNVRHFKGGTTPPRP